MALEHTPDIELRLRQLDLLDRITQISLASNNLQDLLRGTLDLTLEVFKADRAWFLYPCDPDSPSWNVPMERTRPAWPGLFAQGVDMPMSDDIALLFSESLKVNCPIQFAPGTDHPVPPLIAELFSIKSQLMITLRPKIGKEWLFGLHHCSSVVQHDESELQLFTSVAFRIADALGALLTVEQLRKSELHLQKLSDSVIDQAGVLVVVMDKHGRIVRFNKACEKLSGYTFDEVENQYLRDIMLPPGDDSNILLAQHPNGMVGQPNYWLSKSGEHHLIEWNNTQIFDINGNMEFMVGVGIDITERKLAEEELRIAATAFESQECMIITDANHVIVRVNQAFVDDTGYTAEELLGQTPRLLKSGRHDAAFYHAMWETLQRTGKWQGEVWDRRKNGEIYPILLTISAVKGDDGAVTNYIGSHIDISERKAAEEAINNLAFYDSLTRLANRRLLNDRLGQTLAASKRSSRYGALLFMDLDNFKPLNDMYGHGVGDLLLMEVARRITSCVRKVDTVARFGGDEFVVVLSELDVDKAESATQAGIVAEKIRAILAEPYVLAIQQEGKAENITIEHHCTSSIGMMLFIGHEASTEDIIKWADIAMYQAKEAGGNLIRFYDSKV